jgi:L-amino acid N-acyltransferase YncA
MDLQIRHATIADLPAIVDVYNQSIPGGWSTADTRPLAAEERLEWFKKFTPDKRPIWVAVDNAQVVAWVSLSSFYAGRPAYDSTAEISMYVANSHQKRGLGRRLKEFAIQQCPSLGITSVISMFFDHNEATRRLNEQLGFEICGHMKEIAVIEGVKRGTVIAILRIPQE